MREMHMNTLIDTHAHLDMSDLSDNIDIVLEEATNAGVSKIIIPGVTEEAIPNIISLIDTYENLYGAVACHPQDVDKWNDKSFFALDSYAKHDKIIAIGETGLDYYWIKDNKELQKEVFKEHIDLAHKNNLPLIVHDREAHADTMELLKYANSLGVNGVMHCFSGSPEFALECVQLGFYIGLDGPVTFKNAKKPKQVAEAVPLEWLLVETDSPYLTPHPYRGKKPNEPKYVKFVAEEIANIKHLPYEEVAKQTTQNALTLFGLN